MIDAYSNASEYELLQSMRPDYSLAVKSAIKNAVNYAPKNIVLSVLDLCCGTGSVTKEVAYEVGGLKRAVLVDINKELLGKARSSQIKSRKTIFIDGDVLDAKIGGKFDVVFALFAYHHIPNGDKMNFVRKAFSRMDKNAVLVLAEIYFNSKEECIDYYHNLFSSIHKDKQSAGLEKFLVQTAENSDFEFKVSKSFSDLQFTSAGFKLVHEEKIWPPGASGNEGTFVQVYGVK